MLAKIMTMYILNLRNKKIFKTKRITLVNVNILSFVGVEFQMQKAQSANQS